MKIILEIMSGDTDLRPSRRTVLEATGLAGATLALGGVAAASTCSREIALAVEGSLDGTGDSDCQSYRYQTADPCKLVFELSGDGINVDFDLYVNDGSSDCPTPTDHDYGADTTGGDAKLVIDDPDTSVGGVTGLVHSESGSGKYTLYVYEYTS